MPETIREKRREGARERSVSVATTTTRRGVVWGYKVAMLVERTGKGGRPLMPGWEEVYWSKDEREARRTWEALRDNAETRVRFGRSWNGTA
jgi:hypothetical protein